MNKINSVVTVPPQKIIEEVNPEDKPKAKKEEPNLQKRTAVIIVVGVVGVAVLALLIVGAEKIGERQYVYFLDPANSSKPEDVKSQKVYVMTYERFCSSIATVSGLIPPDTDANEKSWLAFIEGESQRIKSFAIYLKPLSKDYRIP